MADLVASRLFEKFFRSAGIRPVSGVSTSVQFLENVISYGRFSGDLTFREFVPVCWHSSCVGCLCHHTNETPVPMNGGTLSKVRGSCVLVGFVSSTVCVCVCVCVFVSVCVCRSCAGVV